MHSLNTNSKKKRRFSQEDIFIQPIQLKRQSSIGLEPAQKFKKVDYKTPQPRKSLEVRKQEKSDLNLELKKRTTEWSKDQLETIEFQKIIQKRKQKNRFKFKTIDIKSIPFRNNNSVSDPYQFERIKSVVDHQIKHQKKFSLQKQSIEIFLLEKELKELNDKEVEEKARNRMLEQLVGMLGNEAYKSEQNGINERSLSLTEKYSKEIRKVQHKTDFFIRLTNDIKQKILSSKKEIFAYRSERVVYSSIFKELEREIKLAQNSYKRILINSMAFFETFCFSRFDTNAERYSLETEKGENGQNYNDYNQFFSNILRSNGVKFTGTMSFSQEETLHDRINSSTAINYYLKERKIIILPRYKEHYQSSRIKLKIETENLSYETIANEMNRLFQALSMDHKIDVNSPVDEHRKNQKTLTNTFMQKTNYEMSKTSKFYAKQSNFIENNVSNCSRTSGNFEIFAQTQVQKVKNLINQVPAQNQNLLRQIEYLDNQINQASDQVVKQKLKIKLNQSQWSPFKEASLLFDMDCDPNSNEEFCKNQLEAIQLLLGLEGDQVSQKRIIYALNKLEEFEIITKTARLFENSPLPQEKSHPNQSQKHHEEEHLNSDRSNVSITLKKRDKNMPSPQKQIQPTEKDLKELRKTRNDLLCRSPQNLNSILKNIQVYDSYERAFERMDFEKEYEAEKNKKKRTLIRREGMVSLCLLRAQEKNKIIKRESSKKRYF